MNTDPSNKYKIVEVGGARILVDTDTTKHYVPLEPTKPFWFDAYEIEPHMLIFFSTILAALNTFGFWRSPSTGNIYSIDKQRKTFTLINGELDEWHWKNVKTLPKLGYRVLVVQEATAGAGKIERKPNEAI
jgi:hypothetical protein